MEKQVKALETLSEQVLAWKSNDDASLSKIVAEFEKVPRQEYSKFYVPVLSDINLGERLVEIGQKYESDADLLTKVISALGNMVTRYELQPSDRIFNFFKETAKNKKVGFYVAIFLPLFPQFKNWDDRWNFLLSIPNFAPKKKSINTFHIQVKRLLAEGEAIPSEVLTKMVAILDGYTKTTELHEVVKEEYINTIKALLD